MTEFIVTIGLPASGKSTLAKQMVRDSANTLKRVNRDDLRAMLDCGAEWNGRQEEWVKKFQARMIGDLLDDGISVICDDTNLDPGVRQHWRQVAQIYEADYVEIDMTHIPLDVLYESDEQRKLSGLPHVGPEVIDKMYNMWFPVTEKSIR